MAVKNKNNSTFAKLSPRHTLLPTENGKKLGVSVRTLPLVSRNLSGLKVRGSSQYSGSKCVDMKLPMKNVPVGNL